MTLFFRVILFSLIITSCGGGESKNSEEFTREEQQIPEPEALQRLYRADIREVNPQTVDDLIGQVTVRLIEDRIEVNVAVYGVPESIHPQRILTGKNCPEASADTNGDGVIDFNEAQVVSGTTFLSLDGDLDDPNEDQSSFPRGGFVLGYTYSESGIRIPDADYDFENRAVMIYGIDGDLTLPIGCAELLQVLGQE